jgi:hypothetical protein
MKCRICKCTDQQACPGGCSWILPGLCSNPECLSSRKLLPTNTRDPGELTFSSVGISYHAGDEYMRIDKTIKKNIKGPNGDGDGVRRGYFFKVDRIGKRFYAVYKYPDGDLIRRRIN